jgi:hypothetical protein
MPQGAGAGSEEHQLLGRAVGYSGRYGSDGRFHLAPPPRPAGITTSRQQLALERGWPGITAQPQPQAKAQAQTQAQAPPSAGGRRVPSQAWSAAAAPSEGASCSGAEAAAAGAAEQPVEEPYFYYQQA